MSVIAQIKRFIRSGRNDSNDDTSSEISQSKAEKIEKAAVFVERQNERKSRMPKYDGLERYKLTGKLGDGAFSVVYKAVDLDTNENVALKVVQKKELNRQQRASVLKEIQIMRTLKHPSIIRLLNYIETDKYYFLVLELCEGGELFHQIVRLTYFSEDLARHCIRQVAEGIRYLHEERGVVHRDIKPENLLFEPIPFHPRVSTPPPTQFEDEPKEDEGEFIPGVGGGGIGKVKIADFGLSKVVWDSQTMTPCGTVGYTAPEIVKDERYSKSVDMWALGCVLYTLLCGFPPFYDESIKVLTEKVAKGQFTFLSPWWDGISNGAKDLVSNLLTIDPDQRLTIDQFLDHPWMKTPEPASATPAMSVSSHATDSLFAAEVETIKSNLENSPEESEAEAFKRMYQQRTQARESDTASIRSGQTTPRRDLYSGVTSMKEMFDVSYAVHRMAEEKARRQKLRARQGGNTPVDHRRSRLMNTLNIDENDSDEDEDEDDDEDDDDGTTTTDDTVNEQDAQLEELRNKLDELAMASNQQLKEVSQLKEEKTQPERRHGRSKRTRSPALFELNIDKATLLERRKKDQGQDDKAEAPSVDIAHAPPQDSAPNP